MSEPLRLHDIRTFETSVAIILPAFNEGPRIFTAGLQALEAIQMCGTTKLDEIIFVDDASTDNTLDEMKRFYLQYRRLATIHVVSLARNRGVGNALRAGIQATTMDSIVLVPGDGVFPASSIRTLLEAREGHLILSDRPARHKDHPFRRTLSRAFSAWFSWIVGQQVPDPHSLYLLPRELVLRASSVLWGEWDCESSSRLDNDYHMHLLVECLREREIGGVVILSTRPELERNSSVFIPSFLTSFAVQCFLLTKSRAFGSFV